MIGNRKHTGYSPFVLGKCDLGDDDHHIADDVGYWPSRVEEKQAKQSNKYGFQW